MVEQVLFGAKMTVDGGHPHPGFGGYLFQGEMGGTGRRENGVGCFQNPCPDIRVQLQLRELHPLQGSHPLQERFAAAEQPVQRGARRPTFRRQAVHGQGSIPILRHQPGRDLEDVFCHRRGDRVRLRHQAPFGGSSPPPTCGCRYDMIDISIYCIILSEENKQPPFRAVVGDRKSAGEIRGRESRTHPGPGSAPDPHDRDTGRSNPPGCRGTHDRCCRAVHPDGCRADSSADRPFARLLAHS